MFNSAAILIDNEIYTAKRIAESSIVEKIEVWANDKTMLLDNTNRQALQDKVTVYKNTLDNQQIGAVILSAVDESHKLTMKDIYLAGSEPQSDRIGQMKGAIQGGDKPFQPEGPMKYTFELVKQEGKRFIKSEKGEYLPGEGP